jgi:tRNA-specific 2-thiouridylase
MLKEIANLKPKTFVGLSGGVDSAVSAALLKKAGHEVTGVYIKVWQPDWIDCTWKEERRDAMRVAAHLNIPFITLDLSDEYKRGVIDYMLSEYMSGRTPNPDVMCNRQVKFGAFWKWAIGQGADYVATGHYAQIKLAKDSDDIVTMPSIINKNNVSRANQFGLYAGTDQNKDQSYFLWTLNRDDLKHILFPVGHLTKPEVRKLAKKFGLPNAEKKDSQGLCFIGKVDIKDFLKHYVKKGQKGSVSGDVLNPKGEIIGKHSGSLFLTLGERHGFTITKKTANDGRYYVVAKDLEKNTITVTMENSIQSSLAPHLEIIITNVNWTGDTPKIGTKILMRTRYRQPLMEAVILKIENEKQPAKVSHKDENGDIVSLVGAHEKVEKYGGDGAPTISSNHTSCTLKCLQAFSPNDPVTPGQSLVIYSKTRVSGNVKLSNSKKPIKKNKGEGVTERCLGGGIIL